MNITVVGSGNIGLSLLGEISRLEYVQATLFCSRPAQFAGRIQIEDREREITYTSGPFRATDQWKEAFSDADMVMCTYPAFLRPKFVTTIAPFLKADASIGFFPAYGGAEFFCSSLLEKGCTIFGLQKVPYVSRTGVDGKTAGIWSRKSELLIGAMPMAHAQRICSEIENLLLIRCTPLANYMEATLLPGNPLLHTCGSYHYLQNYTPGEPFPAPFYYYREWDDNCSETICRMSDELQAICRALPIDLTSVKSIQEYYESPTAADLTAKFHSIASFDELLLPTKRIDGVDVVDLGSRFFIEDLPYGVATIKALGLLAGEETPVTDSILAWYRELTGKEYFKTDDSLGENADETAIPQLFGIDTPEKLADFYGA